MDINSIPDFFLFITIFAEDPKFFKHKGLDYAAIKHAFIRNWKERDIVIGGSTISQQLAKNLYLSNKRSFIRKFKEFIITFIIERKLSKHEILELYLNILDFGIERKGIAWAFEYFYSKKASEINAVESINLIKIISSPRLYRPRDAETRKAWKKVRNNFARRLFCCKIIKKEEYLEIIEKDFNETELSFNSQLQNRMAFFYEIISNQD